MPKKVTVKDSNFNSTFNNIFFVTEEFPKDKVKELHSILNKQFGLNTSIIYVDSDYEAKIINK